MSLEGSVSLEVKYTNPPLSIPNIIVTPYYVNYILITSLVSLIKKALDSSYF